MDLQGVPALVTGGAHRIGRAITVALGEAGCRVAIHYGRSEEAARATADELEARGVTVSLHQGDLADPAAPGQLLAEAAQRLGPLRVLVNSAGIFPEDTLETLSRQDLESSLAINLKAPVFLTQAFAELLPSDLGGAVVNVSDWRTARPYTGHFSYTVSKAALDGFTRAAAVALAPRIRVNGLALGAILPPAGKDQTYLRDLARRIPLRGPGSPESVGAAVRAVLENDFITGQVIGLTGGAELV